jgi:hypothetical protein
MGTIKSTHPDIKVIYEKTPASPVDFSLIRDWVDLVVTSLPTEAAYVALSYVWGQDTGQNNELKHPLPQLISDCLAVTRSLGYRYL